MTESPENSTCMKYISSKKIKNYKAAENSKYPNITSYCKSPTLFN